MSTTPSATEDSVPRANNAEHQDRFEKFCREQEDSIIVDPQHIEPIRLISELDQTLASNLSKMNYKKLLPLQAYSTSILLQDRHLLVRAPTGSGKTAAFLIPAIQYVIRYHRTFDRRTKLPLVLILGNTQNLMEQTFKFACAMAGYDPERKVALTNVRVLDLYAGGYGMQRIRHVQSIEHEILVATCGGVLTALESHKLDLSQLKMLIIDEADKMLNVSRGFGLEVENILSKIPSEAREDLVVAEFSATFFTENNDIVLSDLDKELFRGDTPALIDIPVPRGYITQRVIEKGERVNFAPGWMPNFDKDLSWLVGLLEGDLRMYNMRKEGPFKKSTVIFVERRITSNYLAVFFQQLGYLMEPLNSDYTAFQNRETLRKMMNGEIQGVVATNKLSRGQDIPKVDHVIIYEMAQNFDDYKHRIGRTGRMGKGGRATVLFSISLDYAHVVPLFEFMCYHNQVIPEWLFEEYNRIKENENLFVSAGSNVQSEESGESDEELVQIENNRNSPD